MNPMQPIIERNGVTRFKENAIVQHLLDAGPFDMNHLALQSFTDEDRQQFAQLIGYSVAGYHELSYVTDEAARRASQAARDAGFPNEACCRDMGCPIHCDDAEE